MISGSIALGSSFDFSFSFSFYLPLASEAGVKGGGGLQFGFKITEELEAEGSQGPSYQPEFVKSSVNVCVGYSDEVRNEFR